MLAGYTSQMRSLVYIIGKEVLILCDALIDIFLAQLGARKPNFVRKGDKSVR